MPSNKLPVFIPSDYGLSYDLKQQKELESFGLGWWKGQLKRYLNILAAPSIVDGVNCYASKFAVGAGACDRVFKDCISVTGLARYDIVEPELVSVTDGSMNMYIGNTLYELRNLDFTSSSNRADVALVINNAIDGALVVSEAVSLLTEYWYRLRITYSSEIESPLISNAYDSGEGTYVGNILGLEFMNSVQAGGYTTSDTSDFLEILGFEQDGLTDICSTYSDSGVDEVFFNWNEKYTFNLDSFSTVVGMIESRMSTANTIKLTETTTYTLANEPALFTEAFYLRNPTSSKNLLSAYSLMNIEIFDAELLNIESSFNAILLSAIRTTLHISGDKFISLTGFNDNRTYYQIDGIDYVDVTLTEDYGATIKNTFTDEADGEYLKYLFCDGVDILCRDSYYEIEYDDNGNEYEIGYKQILLNELWKVRDELGTFSDTSGVGLFKEFNGTVYMTVDGLDKVSPIDLAFYISQYADFYIDKASVAWYKKIYYGIISIIVAVIQVVAKIFTTVPVLKQFMQVTIYFLTGGKWISDKDKLDMYSTKIVVAVIVAVGTYATFGTTAPLWSTLANAALSAYSLSEDLKDTERELDRQEKQKALDKEEQELQDKEDEREDMDEYESDSFGVNNQFLVLDRMIDSQKYNVFGNDSMFEIKY